MEASEKPQLPLEGNAAQGAVRAIGDRLVIERLEVSDAGAARVVREQAKEGRKPAETVSRAIEIGARLIEGEGTAANVEFVNAQFERHLGQLAQQLGGMLESGSEELAEQIAGTFGADRSDSVQQQIRETLAKANEHQRTELLRLFNADDGANPLADFKTSLTSKVADAAQRSERQAEALREAHEREARQMREQVSALKTEVARLTEQHHAESRVAEAEEAGTRKGRSFEERVFAALERVAEARGDAALHVGDERGAGGGKKGDVVAEIGATEGTALARVVFEAKDERLSKQAAWKELDSAMVERDADFAVLVVAGEDHIPAGREEMHEYAGNKLIVAVDPENPDERPLEIAYRYARCRVLLARDRDLQLDAAGVRDAAQEAQDALREAQRIRLALTGAEKNVSTAREGLDLMVTTVLERMTRIDRLISEAETT